MTSSLPQQSDDASRDWRVHPGELLAEVMAERGLTQEALAAEMGCSQPGLSLVVTGNRRVTAWLAVRLEAALETPARFWMTAQADYDIHFERERYNAERATAMTGKREP